MMKGYCVGGSSKVVVSRKNPKSNTKNTPSRGKAQAQKAVKKVARKRG